MLTSTGPVLVRDRPAYRPYRAEVQAVRRLSPSFVRVTFGSDDFDVLGTAGLDQRVKIVFPLPGAGLCDLGETDDEALADGSWYELWRALPDAERNPFRTYTVRAVRPDERELDIDFVDHSAEAGDGPAARWLARASVGDRVIVVGPDARSAQSRIGLDWHPGSASRLLLAGDETAAPAICAILESLPAGTDVAAFVEVPRSADILRVDGPCAAAITWLPRDGRAHGTVLDATVRSWVDTHRATILPALAHEPQVLDEVDIDRELLWDSPAVASSGFYAWLAGEASVIKGLRRLLVSEVGVDRRTVAFMGYWRAGRSEAQ